MTIFATLFHFVFILFQIEQLLASGKLIYRSKGILQKLVYIRNSKRLCVYLIEKRPEQMQKSQQRHNAHVTRPKENIQRGHGSTVKYTKCINQLRTKLNAFDAYPTPQCYNVTALKFYVNHGLSWRLLGARYLCCRPKTYFFYLQIKSINTKLCLSNMCIVVPPKESMVMYDNNHSQNRSTSINFLFKRKFVYRCN